MFIFSIANNNIGIWLWPVGYQDISYSTVTAIGSAPPAYRTVVDQFSRTIRYWVVSIHNRKMSFLMHFLYPAIYCHGYLVLCMHIIRLGRLVNSSLYHFYNMLSEVYVLLSWHLTVSLLSLVLRED